MECIENRTRQEGKQLTS